MEASFEKSVKFFVVAKMPATLSSPMPVSIFLLLSGSNVPSGRALNCMNTRFQISMQRGEPALTSAPPVSPFGVRSMWISEQGPQGPVSPIIQKLSFLPHFFMCVSGSSPHLLKTPTQ